MSGAARAVCTQRVKKVQTVSLSLIFIICVVNYMDRGTLSVANPLIRNELGLSVAEMGVLLSAFLWPYAFSLLFAGGFVDRLKPRRVLTISMIVWSIAQGAAGFVVSYGQFLFVRALLGVGEAPMFPTASRVVNDWYHENDQALGVGIWNGAPPLGNAVAPILLTPVMLAFGWSTHARASAKHADAGVQHRHHRIGHVCERCDQALFVTGHIRAKRAAPQLNP